MLPVHTKGAKFMIHQVFKASKIASSEWQKAFNSKDAAGCALQYTEEAIMHAKPLGTFHGRSQIQAFWQDIMNKGFSNVQYNNVKWRAENNNSFILTADWTMNKAFGVVHKEHWKIQNDGKARLEFDVFEILGEK